MVLSPTIYLLHKAIRIGSKVDLPNTQEQIQRGSQNGQTKKHALNEKYTEKELNEMEASNLSDIEFKTVVIRMVTELRGRMDELSENLRR